MLAILQWRRDATARRFAVWMAVGTSFFLGLAAGDFSGTTAVPFSGWLEIVGLFLIIDTATPPCVDVVPHAA